MNRTILSSLENWLFSNDRKPLILRGARQVGKTWVVRELSRKAGYDLIEVNFEKRPELREFFKTAPPERIIDDLETELGVTHSVKSLLFLDEIQAAPEVISKLRWFREELPEQAVIAAGSLLDFVINDHDFSMPVGRISYMYMEPLTYFEFLENSGQAPLFNRIQEFKVGDSWSRLLHDKSVKLFKQYLLVGGMPEAVKTWNADNDYGSVQQIQRDLIATFRDDFNKYKKNIDNELLDAVFLSIPRQLGSKFSFVKAFPDSRAYKVKKAIHLLIAARLAYKVPHSDGNGIPLGAGGNSKFFKINLLDTGLVSTLLGLQKLNSIDLEKYVLSNRGSICEQFIGQELRQFHVPHADTSIYYWQRTGKGQGEIDYLIQHGVNIVPVEVKAGSAGSMKSLHQFNADRSLKLAVRFDLNVPGFFEINQKTTIGKTSNYRLLSLPHYFCGSLNRLLSELN